MTVSSAISILLTFALLQAGQRHDGVYSGSSSLVGLADQYCMGPDGDQVLTWTLAARNGFIPLNMEGFPNLRLPGARGLRGFTRTTDGVEIRVLTAANRVRQFGEDTYYHLCWVSAANANRREVDRELQAYLGVRRFRQEGAFMYPWVTQPDGSRESVSRRDFDLQGFGLSRERGMKVVLTGEWRGQVSVTFMTPVSSCADWCY